MDKMIDAFSEKAKRYLKSVDSRKVFPAPEDVEKMKFLDMPLQDHPVEPLEVINELDKFGSPATVASTGSRYFGFVIGGASPAPLAANLLAGVWDQNAGIEAASPVSSFIETVCRKWLTDILKLPPETEAGFVTGATMANFAGLAAARHALLKKAGWDVENDGLFNAPPIQVIVGEEVHVSVLKALSMLGLGRNKVTKVPADAQGRMTVNLIPEYSEPTLICVQAGNVNTGSFDPISEICEMASSSDAWVHADGAFGLWAAVSPRYAHLCEGIHKADSWATDAHKWLNVPYDSGIVFVRDKEHLISSMSTDAAYLISGAKREPFHYVPELSRRARGVEIWAALRSLGKKGLASLIESNCDNALLFAKKLSAAGYRILNDVVLNQVLVSFGDPETTKRVIRRVQEDGTCWCGGTEWQGKTAMRISVSSWRTTENDVEESSDAIIRIADEENGKSG
ncbi:aminotransferase class V-fold PLP-dependent enzyme [Desulfobacterales bacterium HSG2]|nr:aminotransferase class V-fold PLP-dependent enzyme [Desulfobacterales bacterium HSG2]